MLHILPIEPLEQRYTGQAIKWITEELNNRKIPHLYYSPEVTYTKVTTGQFLDVGGTLKFKLAQLQMIISALMSGDIKNGDKILIFDIWFPGIEAIRYYTDLAKVTVEIYGINHAGRCEITDFIREAGDWADPAELAFLKCCDKILVASKTIKDYMVKYWKGKIDETKIIPFCYPWDAEDVKTSYDEFSDKVAKELKQATGGYIIFPHRISFDKGISDLYYIADKINMPVVVTSSGNFKLPFKHPNITMISGIKKSTYYSYLKNASLYLSTALGEFFGYTLHEAEAFDIPILTRDAAVYREFVPHTNRYKDVHDAIKIINEKSFCKLSSPLPGKGFTKNLVDAVFEKEF